MGVRTLLLGLSAVVVAAVAAPVVGVSVVDATWAEPERAATADTASAATLALRQYVKEQSDTLVGMTRVLAREIKDDHLDASQSSYAPGHRYLARLEPFVQGAGDLAARMDARADAFVDRERDPEFFGFHRLELGLFASKSVTGLAPYADQLNADARELRGRLAAFEADPRLLAESAARSARRVADRKLGGDEERYSKADLWDVEATIDGIRQIVAFLQAQPSGPNRQSLERTGPDFARIDALLEAHKEGCGFKPFDQLRAEDKAALRQAVTALADDLATLRGTFAMQ